MTAKHLLIVWHSRTGAARQMARAACAGAHSICRELEAKDRLTITLRAARATRAQHLLNADAFLFCAPENLGSLSGEMKAFFDRHYYAVLDACSGRPYAVIIAAGTAGSGAARQLERICTGWRLRAIADPLILRNGAQTRQAILAPKRVCPPELARCHELGGTLAALLLL